MRLINNVNSSSVVVFCILFYCVGASIMRLINNVNSSSA